LVLLGKDNEDVEALRRRVADLESAVCEQSRSFSKAIDRMIRETNDRVRYYRYEWQKAVERERFALDRLAEMKGETRYDRDQATDSARTREPVAAGDGDVREGGGAVPPGEAAG
jgi:hypothetical protein